MKIIFPGAALECQMLQPWSYILAPNVIHEEEKLASLITLSLKQIYAGTINIICWDNQHNMLYNAQTHYFVYHLPHFYHLYIFKKKKKQKWHIRETLKFMHGIFKGTYVSFMSSQTATVDKYEECLWIT